MNSATAPADRAPRRMLLLAAALLPLALVSGLFLYKWSAAWSTLQGVRASGVLRKSLDPLASGGSARAALHYFTLVWPALVFGILIGAAVRAFVSPRFIRRWLDAAPRRQHAIGALVGAPLMLCSCCVTPIFSGVFERGARLGPALALMLASPGLNIAAIVLTFLLFPASLAGGRLALSLAAVFGLAALIGRFFDQPIVDRAATERLAALDRDLEAQTGRSLAVRFLRSVVYLTLVTVPFIAAGVLLSGLALPLFSSISPAGGLATVAVVGALATLVALPTFFEIPLALLLLKLGAPSGAALAVLFAGPIINLPSLFVLGRETRPRVALAVGGGIALLACLGGILV